MKLTHSCLLTDNVQNLSSFYQQVLGIDGQEYGPDYVEFTAGEGILAIYNLNSHLELAPGTASPEANKSIILEFEVGDVDKEYQRLQQLGVEIVKPPTTQEWGNRSFYFLDPVGNLINFYCHLAK